MAAGDPRIERYAKLLVERCLDVQPGWEVLIRSTPLARPLLEELQRQIAHRDAYAILRLGYAMWPIDDDWVREAPEELLGELSEVDRFACERMDAIDRWLPESWNGPAPSGSRCQKQRRDAAASMRRHEDQVAFLFFGRGDDPLIRRGGSVTTTSHVHARRACCLLDLVQVSLRLGFVAFLERLEFRESPPPPS